MISYRNKPGISSRDYKKRSSFSRQRNAFLEVTTSSKASAVFRSSIKAILERAKDSKTHLRFNSIMFRILSEDNINPVGLRRVENGNPHLLNHFQFNANASLHNILFAPERYSISLSQGQCTWTLDSFRPSQQVKAPSGATHLKLVSAGVEVDFGNDVAVASISESDYLPLNDVPTGEISLASAVTPNSSLPVFLVAGVQFYTEVNGQFHPLRDKKYNPLMITEVNRN